MIHIDEKIWQEQINGWLIVDCAVRECTIIYLGLRKNVTTEDASLMWDHEIPSKMFVINLRKPGDYFGARTLIDYNRPIFGVARKPVPQGLAVARNNDGQVSVMGGGKKFPNEFIDPGKIPFTERIKCINDYAYSVGNRRKIYKRTDIGQWVRFADLPRGAGEVFDYGFADMDAFSETDMYAVGGRGDIWHFDGKDWIQQGFPSNMQLATVTCAGDGQVYVSGEGGTLWRGRRSTWTCVYEGESSVLWNDVLWFDNKLWLASDYQARIWDGQQLLPITHEGKQISIYGHMDAYSDPSGSGLLVIASPWYVKAYDGKAWRTLVAPYDLDEDGNA